MVFAALRAGARGFLAGTPGPRRFCGGAYGVRGPGSARSVRAAGLVEAFVRGERVGIPAVAADGGGHAAPAPGGLTPRPGGLTPRPGGLTPRPGGLTPREVEVLAEIAAGLSNGEIAVKFRLSDTTVKRTSTICSPRLVRVTALSWSGMRSGEVSRVIPGRPISGGSILGLGDPVDLAYPVRAPVHRQCLGPRLRAGRPAEMMHRRQGEEFLGVSAASADPHQPGVPGVVLDLMAAGGSVGAGLVDHRTCR